MKIFKYNEWRLLVPSGTSKEEAQALFDSIDSSKYKLVSTLKANQRSKVSLINFNSQQLVLKIPVEKNDRIWIRLMSLFRSGEAFKNLLGMGILNDNGIKTTIPVLAAEKRVFGVVINSWLIYHYIDGKPCLNEEQNYPDIVNTLKEIHSKKLLHGDPQIRNFIEKNGDIYAIDSNPKKPGITGFDFAYEWVYLRKSAPGIERFFGEVINSFWYKSAFKFDVVNKTTSQIKHRIRSWLGLKVN